MIAILSPAKNMAHRSLQGLALSRPVFWEQSQKLLAELKKLEPWELESLLQINPSLAMKAFQDYQDFGTGREGTAALLAYQGLAYQNLEAETFTLEDFQFAGQSLRCLSAFYGILRPADEIWPYRLEFLCKWRPWGENLYRFWKDAVYRELYRREDTVINLASAEYSKTVVPYVKPGHRLIACDFLNYRRGKLITLAALAKMARGRMASYMVRNRIQTPEGLKDFSWNGYVFSPGLSDETNFRFVQEENGLFDK